MCIRIHIGTNTLLGILLYHSYNLYSIYKHSTVARHVKILVKLKCKDFDCVYVGPTSHALKTRVKEHAKTRATLDKNSLAKHRMLHNHQIDLESVEIVDKSSAWRQRLIL